MSFILFFLLTNKVRSYRYCEYAKMANMSLCRTVFFYVFLARLRVSKSQHICFSAISLLFFRFANKVGSDRCVYALWINAPNMAVSDSVFLLFFTNKVGSTRSHSNGCFSCYQSVVGFYKLRTKLGVTLNMLT